MGNEFDLHTTAAGDIFRVINVSHDLDVGVVCVKCRQTTRVDVNHLPDGKQISCSNCSRTVPYTRHDADKVLSALRSLR
jgi:hypothetical protein